jgi:hypothetical protein
VQRFAQSDQRGPPLRVDEASFIVLDRDIFTIDVYEIGHTVVEQTWIRGALHLERLFLSDENLYRRYDTVTHHGPAG